MPSNVLPLHLKQTFPPKIWIFTEGKGDGIESRLPFIMFSTLKLKPEITYVNADFRDETTLLRKLILKFPNETILWCF